MKGNQIAAAVNAALKAAGHHEKIKQGKGYVYFYGGHAHEWFSSSVAVCNIGHASVEFWLKEHAALANQPNHEAYINALVEEMHIK